MGLVLRLTMLSLLVAGTALAKAGADPCATRSTAIVVDTKKDRLWLCEEGRSKKRYSVAIGSGGTAKSAEGDKKTPVGSYSVGEPRPSKEFGTFIPIGYPTDEQRKHGASGGAVGIHGPKRRFAWAGRANVWLNWTRGCIAVATDAEIREIASWVQRNKPTLIHID